MKRKVALTIDGETITAEKGEKLLWAALDNGIYIPHLCAVRENELPFASCRLCFVEIEGYSQPVTACTEPVIEGMTVHTRSLRVDRLVKTAFELLLSAHHLECNRCPKNRSCELQEIAKNRGIKLKSRRFKKIERGLPVDTSSPVFDYDPNKCVLCGRCVFICHEKVREGAISFAFRGFERMVTTFGNGPMAESKCIGCGECVRVCPAGSLTFKVQGIKNGCRIEGPVQD